MLLSALLTAYGQQAFEEMQVADCEVGVLFNKSGYSKDTIEYKKPLLYIHEGNTNRCTFWNKEAYKALTGYTLEGSAHETPGLFPALWHRTDLRLYHQFILPELLNFVQQQPKDEIHCFCYSFDYRIKHADEHFITVSQRLLFLPSEVDDHSFSEVGIIVHQKQAALDPCMVLTVENSNKLICLNVHSTFVKLIYSPKLTQSVFTNREREVLQFISEGLNSREIAGRMFVSVNTINNHRKNMLQKTNTNNCFQLLTYAMRNSYL